MIKPFVMINDIGKFLEMGEKRLGVERKKIVDLFHYAHDAGYISLTFQPVSDEEREEILT